MSGIPGNCLATLPDPARSVARHVPETWEGQLRRYMTGLFKLAHDPSSAARKGVCTGLVQLLHLQPDRLAPHLPDIIEYMLRSMQARFPQPLDPRDDLMVCA